MTAPRMTLLDPLLHQIITKSAEGAVEMVSLNAQVNGAKDIIHRAQISDSGSIIIQRLHIWEEDWMTIKGRLENLNQRVTDMRQSLLNGLQAAVDAAGGH